MHQNIRSDHSFDLSSFIYSKAMSNNTHLYHLKSLVQRLIHASPQAFIAAICLLSILAACIVGPYVLPHSYAAQHFDAIQQPPNARFWLGTDALGRDLLVRILHGGRISFAVGFAATGISLIIGLLYGGLAGYIGGWVDKCMMRFVDSLYALPFTVLVVILTVPFGRSLILLFVAIGAVEWLTMARIIRAQVIQVKAQAYIEAAFLLGLPHHQILFKHILPNLSATVIVYSTLIVPASMLLEATLSFLGLGVQPPASSWGILIHDGVFMMETCPWLLIFPISFFAVTLLCLKVFTEGLSRCLHTSTGEYFH